MKGEQMYKWAIDLFPIHRSITGIGVRKTLKYIKNVIPELQLHSVNSNTKVFDWKVPLEWEITEAKILDEHNNIIVDFKENNLHVVAYSTPIDKYISLDDLEEHLFYLPDNPKAIPYITSYYKEFWGFCITYEQRKKLKNIKYRVIIKSRLFEGQLNYGEIIIPGESKKEIMLSTYICHPSMGNNETSGIVVAMNLIKWIQLKKRKYTYRILFIPETIGAITYLSINSKYLELKNSVVAGFQITCVGDNNNVSYIKSKYENTLTDKVVQHYLKENDIQHKTFTFLERGSDERQWSSPGIDLPFVSLIRSKYLDFKEYHTSLDDLNFISQDGLYGGYKNIKECLKILETNIIYKSKILCEPQLGMRNLYPTISTIKSKSIIRDLTNFLTYCNGKYDIISISEITKINYNKCIEIADILKNHDIIEEI